MNFSTPTSPSSSTTTPPSRRSAHYHTRSRLSLRVISTSFTRRWRFLTQTVSRSLPRSLGNLGRCFQVSVYPLGTSPQQRTRPLPGSGTSTFRLSLQNAQAPSLQPACRQYTTSPWLLRRKHRTALLLRVLSGSTPTKLTFGCDSLNIILNRHIQADLFYK